MDNEGIKALTTKTLLLYDCDTQKPDEKKEKIIRKTIPYNRNNPIQIGIENLFSIKTIDKLRQANIKFINVIPEFTATEGGKQTKHPEVLSVNKDEKKNICDWLCEHGDKSDFEGLKVVVELIQEFVGEPKLTH
jgi:hypothetical protein